MLKWSFLICSVPVAFNGVQTRVLVDATGNCSNRPLSLLSNFGQPLKRLANQALEAKHVLQERRGAEGVWNPKVYQK